MSKCLVSEDALAPAVLVALCAILLVPPALRALASLRRRADRATSTEPHGRRERDRPDRERDDGSRLHPITSFGAWGRADGCLNSPRFLLPVEGGVLVADSGNDRLQIFTADGSHVRTMRAWSLVRARAGAGARSRHGRSGPTLTFGQVRTIQGSRPGHPTGLATDGTHVWVS